MTTVNTAFGLPSDGKNLGEFPSYASLPSIAVNGDSATLSDGSEYYYGGNIWILLPSEPQDQDWKTPAGAYPHSGFDFTAEIWHDGSAKIADASSNAFGSYSLAVGTGSQAIGSTSFAQGAGALANFPNAVAMGQNAQANKHYAFAQGLDCIVTGDASVAMGAFNEASSVTSTVIGWGNTAMGNNQAFASGFKNQVLGGQSFAFGNQNKTTLTADQAGVLGGISNEVSGAQSLAGGNSVTVAGSQSLGFGQSINLDGNASVAFGQSPATFVEDNGLFVKDKGHYYDVLIFSGNYTVQNYDYALLHNGATPSTITLPNNSTDGRVLKIKNMGATLTVQPSVGTIDGSASITLATGQSTEVIRFSDGNWYVF